MRCCSSKIADRRLGGRSLSDNEFIFLKEQCVQLRANDYRMQELLRFVI